MVDISTLKVVVRLNDRDFRQSINDMKDKLRDLERHINRVDGKTIRLNTDLQFRDEFRDLHRAITIAQRRDINIDVDVDTSDLVAALTAQQSGRFGGSAMGFGAARRSIQEGGLTNLNLRMEDLHNAVAKLLPLFANFILAIPAVVTALATLAAAAYAAAAAFTAITALSVLGAAIGEAGGGMPTFEDITAVFREIRDVLFEGVAPAAQMLAPLFERFTDGLEALLTTLASQRNLISQLADTATEFGGFLLDFLPRAVRVAGVLVETFEPVFSAMGQVFNVVGLVKELANATMLAAPALAELGQLLIHMLPTLVRLSVGFLEVSVSILKIVNAFGQVLGVLPITSEQFGILIGTVLSATTALLILNSALVQAAGSALVKLGTSIMSVLPSLSSFVSANTMATLSALGLAGAIRVVTGAILGLLAVTGIGLLIAGISSLAAEFLFADRAIRDATSSLESFQQVNSRIGGGTGPYDAPPSGAGTASGQSRVQVNDVDIETTGDRETDRANISTTMWKMSQTGSSL